MTKRPWWRPSGLGLRVMAVIGAALLPLAVLSYVQTIATRDHAEHHARAAILGETLLAAAPLVEVIKQAQGTASTLANLIPSALANPGACQALMEQTERKAAGSYSMVAFVPLEGPIQCSAPPAKPNIDLYAWRAGRLVAPGLQLTVERSGRAPEPSLSLSAPVYAEGGILLGFVALSMPRTVLMPRHTPAPRMTEAPLVLFTFDENGTLLNSSTDLDVVPAMLPANIAFSDYVNEGKHSFLGTTSDGRRNAFAVVPISPGGLLLLGTWPSERLAISGFGLDLPPLTLPALMWFASLLAAYLAAESQMLRPINRLRERIVSFSKGDRSLTSPDLSGAAPELREVGEVYDTMTEAIVHHEAHLENMIRQQEVLLREVHHRVKNNLQLIASILNMQLRDARSEETRAAMTSVRERVISLATIHRELYQIADIADVGAKDILTQILDHTVKLGAEPGQRFDISVTVDETIRLAPDQAVPLALFLTEGVTNVLKHAGGGAGSVSYIKLNVVRQGNGRALMSLENSLNRIQSTDPLAALDAEPEGIGHKLLAGFASQLEGRMERQRRSRSYRLTLEFPLHPLSEVSLAKATQ